MGSNKLISSYVSWGQISVVISVSLTIHVAANGHQKQKFNILVSHSIKQIPQRQTLHDFVVAR